MKLLLGILIVFGSAIWFWIYDKGYVSLYGTKYDATSSDSWMFYFWLIFIPAYLLRAVYLFWVERSFLPKTDKDHTEDSEKTKPNKKQD